MNTSEVIFHFLKANALDEYGELLDIVNNDFKNTKIRLSYFTKNFAHFVLKYEIKERFSDITELEEFNKHNDNDIIHLIIDAIYQDNLSVSDAVEKIYDVDGVFPVYKNADTQLMKLMNISKEFNLSSAGLQDLSDEIENSTSFKLNMLANVADFLFYIYSGKIYKGNDLRLKKRGALLNKLLSIVHQPQIF